MFMNLHTLPAGQCMYTLGVSGPSWLGCYEEVDQIARQDLTAAEVVEVAASRIRHLYGADAFVVGVADQSHGGVLFDVTGATPTEWEAEALPLSPRPTRAAGQEAELRHENATLRADLARVTTERDALAASVARVREMHVDGGESRGYFPGEKGYGWRDHCCIECGSIGEYGVEWPCPTIRALDA